jgi:hypothetical protein
MQPLTNTRHVDFATPLAAPDAVTRAVADGLRRNGSRIVSASGGVVAFSGPSAWYFGFSMRRKAAAVVSSGVVTIDPAAPDRRIRVELRFNTLFYLLPALAACFMVFADGGPGERLSMLTFIGGIWWVHYALAWWAYESWVREAASRA